MKERHNMTMARKKFINSYVL